MWHLYDCQMNVEQNIINIMLNEMLYHSKLFILFFIYREIVILNIFAYSFFLFVSQMNQRSESNHIQQVLNTQHKTDSHCLKYSLSVKNIGITSVLFYLGNTNKPSFCFGFCTLRLKCIKYIYLHLFTCVTIFISPFMKHWIPCAYVSVNSLRRLLLPFFYLYFHHFP